MHILFILIYVDILALLLLTTLFQPYLILMFLIMDETKRVKIIVSVSIIVVLLDQGHYLVYKCYLCFPFVARYRSQAMARMQLVAILGLFVAVAAFDLASCESLCAVTMYHGFKDVSFI